MFKFPAPNRVALYIGAVAAFLGGLAPVVANLDWQSTAGVIAGLAVIASYVNTFVVGQWKHETKPEMLRDPADDRTHARDLEVRDLHDGAD